MIKEDSRVQTPMLSMYLMSLFCFVVTSTAVPLKSRLKQRVSAKQQAHKCQVKKTRYSSKMLVFLPRIFVYFFTVYKRNYPQHYHVLLHFNKLAY